MGRRRRQKTQIKQKEEKEEEELDHKSLLLKTLEEEKDIRIRGPIDFHPTVGLVVAIPIPNSGGKILVRYPLLNYSVLNPGESLNIEGIGPVKVEIEPGCIIDKNLSNMILEQTTKPITKDDIPPPESSRIIEDLVSLLKEYIYFDEEMWHYVLACWSVGTYFFPMFLYYPIMNFEGEQETGKTTILDVLAKICWNPRGPQASFTLPSMFRIIHCSKPTYLIDMRDMRRTLTEEHKSIIEGGTERGKYAERVDLDTMISQQFDIYCPKAIATRQGLDIGKKQIVVITSRARDIKYSLNRCNLPEDGRFDEIKERILLYQWSASKDLFMEYKEIKQDSTLNGRAFDYSHALLAVAKLFFPPIYDEMRKFLAEKYRRQESADVMGEIEDAILGILLHDDRDEYIILNKTITEAVSNVLGRPIYPIQVYYAMMHLKVYDDYWKTGGTIKYKINMKKVREKAKERGIELEEREESIPIPQQSSIS